MSKVQWLKDQDWILWGAAGCALVGTAHAEYTLAVATHVHPVVALAVPGALDLYVIRALRLRRDVFAAVLVMVAANVAAHLVTAEVIPVDWRLISAVGAVAPLVLWRVYSLRYAVPRRVRQADTADVVSTPVVSEPEPGVSVPYLKDSGQYTVTIDVPADAYPDVPEGGWPYLKNRMFAPCPHMECFGRDECLYPDVPDDVPAGWVAEYAADQREDAPPLMDVPEPYPFVLDGVEERDQDVLGHFTAYLKTCQEAGEKPTVAGTRQACGCGQPKAYRLLGYAGYPQKEDG